MKIPFLDIRASYHELREDLDAAYHRVMDSGWYLLGDELNQFEQEFADYVKQIMPLVLEMDLTHLL